MSFFNPSSPFSIFNIFTLLGGLALFLYGMKIMSSGLEKLAGGKLEGLLKKMTSNPFKSLALGAGITIAIQSSSALTVMLVGLVNSGIMQLPQTVGIIMGSNIGTTLTAWITSLAGIDGGNFFMTLLKPSSFSPIIALIGVLLIMVAKSDKRRSVGSIFIGFAVLMFGMGFMSDAMESLAELEGFTSVLTAFNNPLLGVLVGTVFTGIIQSSAASVAVLQGLAGTGHVTFAMAFPIIMGQNIGTTVTAAISSIGVNKSAKRVAVVHAAFNIIGTVLFLIVYGVLYLFVPKLPLFQMAIDEFGIAISHTVFNVVSTVILLPCSKLLVKIAERLIKEKSEDGKDSEVVCFLDRRLFATPSIAVGECDARATEMTRLAREAITSALDYLKKPDAKLRDHILDLEDRIDKYEDALGKYLVALSAHALSDRDSRESAKLLHSIGNLERIGDHAVNLVKVADEIADKGLAFSPAAEREIAVLDRATRDILDITVAAFCQDDAESAGRVEPLEQVIDYLIAEIRSRHISRLQKGNCTVEMGFILADLLNNYERVSDHCSNIAVAVIESESASDPGAHAYLQEFKSSHGFNEVFERYMGKYAL
ncbi:MAG: Na/Pi cotransporter family protein [Clostridia bacterium]|nr:Na/Pi cotransporter family protein [Clostridia bacterium]MBQ9735370.1 Na/Pi cotransporter family protein [Clostridia bacterium]